MNQKSIHYLYPSDITWLEYISGGRIHPNEQQIWDLENKIGSPLPGAFREFVLLTGSDYDYLLGIGGGVSSLDKIDYIFDQAKMMLGWYGIVLDKFFPFSTYNCDQFLFFYLDQGDDPPVYRFEDQLAHQGDEYISGSSSWGLPKGVSKLKNSISELVHHIVETHKV